MNTTKPIRLGIWGCGAMGNYHAKKFREDPRVELTACCDRHLPKARELAQTWQIPVVTQDFETLTRECDAITCALVDRDHAQAAQWAAQAGLPLFLEKPMARNCAETEELVGLFAQKQIPLVINFSKRNMPALAHARALIASGTLGVVQEARFAYLQSWLIDSSWGDWRTDSRWGWRTREDLSCHGVLGDLASHLFDATVFLLGQAQRPRFTVVQASRTPEENGLGGAWDEVQLQGLWETGGPVVSATWKVSHKSPGNLDTLTINLTGTLGCLEINTDNGRDSVLWTPAKGVPQRWTSPPVTSTYQGFVDVVLTPGLMHPNLPDGASGHEVQVLLDHAQAALLAAEERL